MVARIAVALAAKAIVVEVIHLAGAPYPPSVTSWWDINHRLSK